MSNFLKTESLIINYSAPTLCEIKPANLFTLSEEQFKTIDAEKWEFKLKAQNLSLTYFKTPSNRWMILIYNYSWIREIISDGLVQSHLRGKGYQNPLDAALTLKELFTRLKNPKDFPHEIGFFLGYPFEDVIAFEKNRGQIAPEADDIVKCQEWTKAAM